MSLGVVAAMFGLTYLPQVAVLAFISGPLGWFVVGGRGSSTEAVF